jgi:hypothetical protein
MTQRATPGVIRLPRLTRSSGGFYKPAPVGIPIATHGQLKHRRLQMDKVLLMVVALVAALKTGGRGARTNTFHASSAGE